MIIYKFLECLKHVKKVHTLEKVGVKRAVPHVYTWITTEELHLVWRKKKKKKRTVETKKGKKQYNLTFLCLFGFFLQNKMCLRKYTHMYARTHEKWTLDSRMIRRVKPQTWVQVYIIVAYVTELSTNGEPTSSTSLRSF